MHRSLFLLLAAALACSDPPPSKYPTQQISVEDTKLGPRDLFEVHVFQQADLTGQFEVSPECTITYPLIGVLEVCGLSPPQIEKKIKDGLVDGYLKNPQVSVVIKEFRSKTLSVFGQVKKPGTLPYTVGMTVVEAISQAGGFNEMARKNAVNVTRVARDPSTKTTSKKSYTVPVDSIGQGTAANFYVRPGDVIFVPRRIF
jgi:protein involved in polysaccharide export with SLBB domain